MGYLRAVARTSRVPSPPAAPAADRPTVLVVDDREVDRRLLERALTAAGYEVTEAASGNEALALIRNRPFDAAVVDLRLPGMEGIDLLRLIKEHSLDIEVLVMTADPTADRAVEALEQGAFDYIGEPLNPGELRHRMGRLVEKSRLRREVRSLRTALRDLVGEIGLADLPAISARASAATQPAAPATGAKIPALSVALDRLEYEVMLRALEVHGNDRRRAARALGISTRTFYRRLREHRLR